MTFMPDAHRPKDDDDLDGCWAGGTSSCRAAASGPSGLCPDHLVEVTSGEPRNMAALDYHAIRRVPPALEDT